jgi:hypothetical protein
MKGFPFIKTPSDYIKTELSARKNNIAASQMRPWISVTSNLGPSGKTLASETYNTLIYTDTKKNLTAGYDVSGEVKYKPKPLVTDFSIDFSSRGTLRKGTVKIKCFTISQVEEIQKYFMEPGLSVFVQWGWSKTASTGATISADGVGKSTQQSYYRKYDTLEAKRDSSLGCYDNMLGIITKAETSVSDEDFIVTCKIVSLGELLSGRSPSGVESIATDASSPPNKYSILDILTLRIGDDKSKVKVNWCYFFNQLPEQFMKSYIKSWGEVNTNHETDFINYDEVWSEDVKSETAKSSWYEFGSNQFTFYSKVFKAEDSSSPISPKKYLKFSTFINLYNEICKFKLSGNGLLTYQIDIGTKDRPVTICGSYPGIFSVDDSVFIPNDQAVNWFNESGYYKYAGPNRAGAGPAIIDNSVRTLSGANNVSFPYKTSSVTMQDGTTYSFPVGSFGWIGDLYIDNDLAMEALKNTSGDVKDTLDSLLKEMSEATDGMWNFQIKEDTSNKYRLVIVDGNLLNSPAAIKPLELWYHGPNSIFLNASFNFDIPKGMANRIVAQRAKNDSTVISEQTGVRALFSTQTDIVIDGEFINAETKQSTQAGSAPITSEEEALQNWQGFTRMSKIVIQPIISKLGIMTIGPDISTYLLAGISSNNEHFNLLRKKAITTGQSSTSSPLPLKINFTVMGISGFKFGDMLIIKGLPSQYSKGNGAFMVTEITHKVDHSMWTTDVEAMFRPYMVT